MGEACITPFLVDQAVKNVNCMLSPTIMRMMKGVPKSQKQQLDQAFARWLERRIRALEHLSRKASADTILAVARCLSLQAVAETALVALAKLVKRMDAKTPDVQKISKAQEWFEKYTDLTFENLFRNALLNTPHGERTEVKSIRHALRAATHVVD